MTLSDICSALSTLVSRPKCKQADMNAALLSNLRRVVEMCDTGFLSSISSQLSAILQSTASVRQQFVAACLHLLTLLTDELVRLREKSAKMSDLDQLSTPRLSPDALSVSQQQTVSNALQFVVALGVYPYLQSGVGLPLSARLKQSQLLGFSDILCASEARVDEEFVRRHVETVLALCKCLCHAALRSVIISKHLVDLLASLLQISFFPDYQGCRNDECNEALKNLVDETYQPLIIRQLLLLQGPPPRQSQKESVNRANSLTTKEACVTPKWLRDACGRLLSERLMKDKGVYAVIVAIIDVPGISSEMLWKRCEMVSQLVANCPRQAESVEEYYKTIGPQILNILKTSTQDSTKAAYLQVAVSTISAVFERNETLAWEYLLWPAMQPLCYMLKDSHLHSTFNFPIRTRDTWLLSSEEEVSECVECLHKMFVQCNCLGPHVAHHLSVVMPALVRLHCVSTRSVSHLRSLSQEVLTTFIKRVENKVTVTVLSQSLMPYTSFMSKASNDHVISDLDVFNNDMGLVRGPSGGLMVVNSFCPCPQSDLVLIKRNFQTECDWLVSTVQDPSCASGFLQILFEELGAALCVPQPEESDKSLLTVEETLEGSSRQHALILTNYCAALCQELSQSMFDDPVVLINFLAASFRQSVLELTYCKPGLALETLPLAIGLTSALLAAEQKVLKAHRTQINSLLPHLEVLSNEHPDSSTRELLCDIQIAIVTHGAVWSGISEKGDDNEDKVEETNGLFRGAMEELLDPLLPVRAHGLRQLTSLIQKRDPEATSNSDKLLLIFRQQLEHSDSYIYLAAINGLVALGDRFPDQVVSVLCKQFALFYGDDNGDVSWRARGLAKPSVCDKEKPRLNPDLRMKLGEALVKLTQLLGDLLPRYSQPLLSAVLCTVKDSDELVRASSMSNLATVCNRLQFSLGGVLHELLGCITAVVSHDPSPRVRRAAVLVVEKMITGLGKSCLEVMGDSIRDVYRLLKQVHASERDEQTRIQAEAALGELDSIMRQGLFPSQELRKKIVVLGDT